jgi:monomeric sarcosine oxidase
MCSYDVIVLGAGGIGSCTLWQLAKRGLSVLGIDRYEPPHEMGSSHGQTRIIRQAYFEHPDYVPLVQHATQGWRELERETAGQLLFPIGLVEVGPADGVLVPGILRAAHQHALEVEPLTPRQVERRWPQLRVPQELRAVYEPAAGYLRVEQCVAAALQEARRQGAELRTMTEATGWHSRGNRIVVETTSGEFTCQRLVVTAGPWAAALLGELNLGLHVRRQAQFWFRAPAEAAADRLPLFFYELPTGMFYGFPALDDRGVKVCDHAAGASVENPLHVDRDLDQGELAKVSRFLQAHLPAIPAELSDHRVCLYTMSPDEHFVVDRHPVDPRIVFAAGMSGHGFKFAPVLGEALADLAWDGATRLPIGFLSATRFA